MANDEKNKANRDYKYIDNIKESHNMFQKHNFYNDNVRYLIIFVP